MIYPIYKIANEKFLPFNANSYTNDSILCSNGINFLISDSELIAPAIRKTNTNIIWGDLGLFLDNDENIDYKYNPKLKVPIKLRLFERYTNSGTINTIIDTVYVNIDKINNIVTGAALFELNRLLEKFYPDILKPENKEVYDYINNVAAIRIFSLFNFYYFLDNKDFKDLINKNVFNIAKEKMCYTKSTVKRKLQELNSITPSVEIQEKIKDNKFIEKLYNKSRNNKEKILKLLSLGLTPDEMIKFYNLFNFTLKEIECFESLVIFSGHTASEVIKNISKSKHWDYNSDFYSFYYFLNNYKYSFLDEDARQEVLCKTKSIFDECFKLENRDICNVFSNEVKLIINDVTFNTINNLFKNCYDNITSMISVDAITDAIKNTNWFKEYRLITSLSEILVNDSSRNSLLLYWDIFEKIKNKEHVLLYNENLKCITVFDLRTGKIHSSDSNEDYSELENALNSVLREPYQKKNSLFSLI